MPYDGTSNGARWPIRGESWFTGLILQGLEPSQIDVLVQYRGGNDLDEQR